MNLFYADTTALHKIYVKLKKRRVMALILHEILNCTENIPLPIS